MLTYRPRTLLAVQLLLGVALATLSWLVVAGKCTRLDQYAIDHWMTRVGTGPAHNSVWDAIAPYPAGGSLAQIAFNIWTFPASVLVSGVLLALCCVVLERRGQHQAAGGWIIAWVVVNAIEVAGKGLLHRPALSAAVHDARVPVAGFATSFPSGHTARALVVAFMLATVWPRLSRPAYLWAAVTCILLVASGDHTPSDIAGGALTALLVLAALAWWGNEPRALELPVREGTPLRLSWRRN